MEHGIIEDIDLSEVKFIQRIYDGKYSEIFKVEALGKVCVLKVYHGHCNAYWEPVESTLFRWESTAYRRFKETGLCTRGIVPDFYGPITTIDPGQRPELRSFCKDPLPPKAILIEYIPRVQRISLETYSENRVAKLADLLAEIHAVRVVHGDPYPRNMFMAPHEHGERLLWMDFDRARTFPLDQDPTDEEAKKFTLDMALTREYIIRPATGEDPDWIMMWTREMTLPFGTC